MAVSAFWYARGFLAAFNKEIDWAADANKVMLTTSTYTPNQDTHDYHNDVTNEVANGNGYTTGGAALASPTIVNTLNVVKLAAEATTVWAASTITARRAVVYDTTPGSTSTNPLLFWVDFGADVSSVSGSFTITWDAAGMATITPADATGYP